MKDIAFLGMGVMGSAMAANLAKAGNRVNIWNRTPDRAEISRAVTAGATWKPTIGEAVSRAEVIFLCLGDGVDGAEVLLHPPGVVEFAPAGSVVVDTSTIGPLAAQTLGRALAEHHFAYLDAPVSGGDIGAQQGTLTFMVGGNPVHYNTIIPLLQAMGKHIFYCGPIGSGQAVKLCNQVLVSHYMMGICEAMQLAQNLSIDPELVVSICGSGAAASWALSHLGLKVAEEDFRPGFMIKHMVKDLGLVAEASAGMALPGTTLATQLFSQVSQLPDGSVQGTQAMIRAYRS